MKNVAIFKTAILPSTQTFIPAQVNALRQFHPQYVGLERIENGYPIGLDPILLVKGRSTAARVRKLLYKFTGIGSKFHREIAEANPSLLHAHFVLDGIHALSIADRLNIPMIVTLHGHIPTSYGRALRPTSTDHILYSLRLRALWRKVSVFICVSDFIRRRALEIGYPTEKLRVHYIGTDRQMFMPSSQPRDPNLVLFVGRLAEKKGGDFLLRAMCKVKRAVPDSKLVMIGDGPEKQKLEQLSRELGLSVHFTGELNGVQVRDWLTRARVFAGPSITASDGEAEALGMVFAEAQATGLPVAAFSHGGIPEVVRHGETGLLAPERDIDALANNIVQFLQDQSLWTSFSARSIQWVAQRFDLVKQTQELEQIYASVLPPEQV